MTSPHIVVGIGLRRVRTETGGSPPTTHSPTHHHHHLPPPLSHLPSPHSTLPPPCPSVVKPLRSAMADRAAGAVQRRERRQRSWWRHEQLPLWRRPSTSAQRPRPVVEEAREWVEVESHNMPRHQGTPPTGTRPEPLADGWGPQRVLERAACPRSSSSLESSMCRSRSVSARRGRRRSGERSRRGRSRSRRSGSTSRSRQCLTLLAAQAPPLRVRGRLRGKAKREGGRMRGRDPGRACSGVPSGRERARAAVSGTGY